MWTLITTIYWERKKLLNSFVIYSTFHLLDSNIFWFGLTLSAPTPQNGRTHSNNSSATFDELLKFKFIKIYKPFDDTIEVRSVFLDISKAFHKVWHDEVIFKLEQNSISGDLLNFFIDFYVIGSKDLCLLVSFQLGFW